MNLKNLAAVLKSLDALPEAPVSEKREILDMSNFTTKRLPIRKYLTLVATLKAYISGHSKKSLLLPHPRQRDTLARMSKAVSRKGHLSKLAASHVEIVIAIFNNQMYLVDGNHRSLFWLDYDIASLPSHVNIVVKMFDDAEEFINLYYQYDSKAAIETGRQQLYGYMSDAKYADKIQTAFVRNGEFLSALQHLPGYCKGCDAEFMVAWEDEVLALDALLVGTKGKRNNGIVAALLTLFRTQVHADVLNFYRVMQRVEVLRKADLLDKMPITPTEAILDNLCKALAGAVARGNEALIVTKLDLTMAAYREFKEQLDADLVKATPIRTRVKKAA